jgi:hypothetical protein
MVMELLIPSEAPRRPWEKVAIDIALIKGRDYLVVIDYFSRYWEVALLNATTATAVIGKVKAIFARFGIPDEVRTDNCPQFGGEFKQFAKDYNFRLITSSAYLARSNGEAEAGVKIVKNILSKERACNLGLLVYRSTPLETGHSPAELSMGRKLRTNIPMVEKALDPKWPSLKEQRTKRRTKKMKDKYRSDLRHQTRELTELLPGDRVWIKKCYGTVVNRRAEPRSYDIKTPEGEFRRNRACLVLAPNKEHYSADTQPEDGGQSSTAIDLGIEGGRRSRHGRIIRSPVDCETCSAKTVISSKKGRVLG